MIMSRKEPICSRTVSYTHLQHIFNADFTIHGGGNTKLKTAFFDFYRKETDGPSVPNVADGKGTIAIYSTSLANTDQPCMKWDSLDEAVYRAVAIKLDQSELTMIDVYKRQCIYGNVHL